ncbi:MAG: hypothetical protein K2W96_07070 [Gemmataceae bacterium]|nr:hypothetical protein [Gemmataceae bacterium]
MSRLVLAVALVLGADKAEPEPKPAAPPKADIRGVVKMGTPVKIRGAVFRMMVEGKKEADTKHDKARVSLKPGGKVWLWKDGKKVAAAFKDIKPGCVVQCDFVGAVRESYPVQADTDEILILSFPKK